MSKSMQSSIFKQENVKKKAKKRNPRKAVHIAAPKMKSRRKARIITTEFHRLTKELDQIKASKDIKVDVKKDKIQEIEKKIQEIGGRTAYQDASILSTSFHRTSKWVFQLLTKYQLRPKTKEPPLRVLEVGAINTQLIVCPWLNVRAIDLQSRHEKIEQCDFFDLIPSQEYQVVVSSMVINCVPDAKKRGEMLRLYYKHLKPNGLLFLMLPLLCLRQSNYMTYDHFLMLLQLVGFQLRDCKETPKVAFFCFERQDDLEKKNTENIKNPRKKYPYETKRNDFSIIL